MVVQVQKVDWNDYIYIKGMIDQFWCSQEGCYFMGVENCTALQLVDVIKV